MSRAEMEEVLAQVPQTASDVLARITPYLLGVGDQLQEDILGILQITAGGSYWCLIVSLTKLISVAHDGTVQTWNYRDCAHVQYLPGRKKLRGGYNFSLLRVELSNGQVLTFEMTGPHEYGRQVGKSLENAHRNARNFDH